MILRRTPIKRSRSPLAKVGRKAKRERAAVDRFRRAVKAQAAGQCEGYIHEICADYPHLGSQAHHIWPEDRDAGRHEPSRGAWLCPGAHRWVHDHSNSAAHMGLLRPELTS